MSFTHTRKMGVEIEFYGVNHRELFEAMKEAGIPVVNHFVDYAPESNDFWIITNDISIEQHDSIELVSRILSGQEGLTEVRKVCSILNKLGARVSKKCGLHVHVDANDLDVDSIKNLIRRYSLFESEFDSFMPRTRRNNNNEYCRSMNNVANSRFTGDSVTELLYNMYHQLSYGRYYKLNVLAYLRHGTVEFRHHSGTVNAEKITNWMQMCVSFVETTKNTNAVNTHPYINLDPEVVTYFKGRAQHFLENP